MDESQFAKGEQGRYLGIVDGSDKMRKLALVEFLEEGDWSNFGLYGCLFAKVAIEGGILLKEPTKKLSHCIVIK